MGAWIRVGAVLAILTVTFSGFPASADGGPPDEIGRFVRAGVSGTLTEDDATVASDQVIVDAPWMSSRIKVDQTWLGDKLGAWSATVPFSMDPQGRAVIEGDEDIEFNAWALSSTPAFTLGSFDSVRFQERPMRISVEDSGNGSYTLDMDDGDTSGQQVYIAKQWLWDLGMHRATATHEDGYALEVTPSTDGAGYWIDVPHFTEVVINPADLSVKGKQGLLVTDHPGERRWDATNESLEIDVGNYSAMYELLVEKDWVDLNIYPPFNNSHPSTTTTHLGVEYYDFALDTQATPVIVNLRPLDEPDTRDLLKECDLIFGSNCTLDMEGIARAICNGPLCSVDGIAANWTLYRDICVASNCSSSPGGITITMNVIFDQFSQMLELCSEGLLSESECTDILDLYQDLSKMFYGDSDAAENHQEADHPSSLYLDNYANDGSGGWSLLPGGAGQVPLPAGTYLTMGLYPIPDPDGYIRQHAEYSSVNAWRGSPDYHVNDQASNLYFPADPPDNSDEIRDETMDCMAAAGGVLGSIGVPPNPWAMMQAMEKLDDECREMAESMNSEGYWGGDFTYTNCWGANCPQRYGLYPTIWRGAIDNLDLIVSLESEVTIPGGQTETLAGYWTNAPPYYGYHPNRNAFMYNDTQGIRPLAYNASMNFGAESSSASASITIESTLVELVLDVSTDVLQLGTSSIGDIWFDPVTLSLVIDCDSNCGDTALVEIASETGTGVITPGNATAHTVGMKFFGGQGAATITILGLTLSDLTLNGEFSGGDFSHAPE